MKIPTKFELNTEDFKIYFDNSKKTHVCESIETGEKTNVGALGIFMQMGILKSLEEDKKTNVRLSILSEKVESLEKKLDDLLKNLTVPEAKVAERKEVIIGKTEEKKRPTEKNENLKSEEKKTEIEKRIRKKLLEESASEEEELEEIEEEPTEENQEVVIEEASNAVKESEEEIDNWMDI